MISDPLFPPDANAQDKSEQPVTWVVSHVHPLVPSMKIVRMFIDGTGIAIYSVSDDGITGMRNLVPMDRTRLVEEAMPMEVFVEEIADAEEAAGPMGDDNDDEDDAPSPPRPELQRVPTPTEETPATAATSDEQQPAS